MHNNKNNSEDIILNFFSTPNVTYYCLSWNVLSASLQQKKINLITVTDTSILFKYPYCVQLTFVRYFLQIPSKLYGKI